jgi:hypothetical protein
MVHLRNGGAMKEERMSAAAAAVMTAVANESVGVGVTIAKHTPTTSGNAVVIGIRKGTMNGTTGESATASATDHERPAQELRPKTSAKIPTPPCP